MKKIEIEPKDITGRFVLRQGLAIGELGEHEYHTDMCVASSNIIINYRGKQVSVSFSEIVRQTLDSMEKEWFV